MDSTAYSGSAASAPRPIPTQLANLLLAAFQGGMLLAQVARDIAPLKDALQAAIDYVETFAILRDS